MRSPYTLFYIFSLMVLFNQATSQTVMGPLGEEFSMRIVAKQLSDPWEVTYGPDQYLWVTEAKGYRVLRINPEDESKTVLLDLNEARLFPRYDKIPDEKDGGKPWPQGGLMGMALHPQLLEGKPYVFLAYIFDYDGIKKEGKGVAKEQGGHFFKTKIVRYEYEVASQKLKNPVILCDTIPGSNDHNGGRLVIASVNNKPYLFYTVGDMGAGQFDNGNRKNNAQTPDRYEGKILRFNVEPDNDHGKYDQWIPQDNPFNGKHENAVWTIGNRNPQGLAYANIGGVRKLYSSEHGPFSDDEINIIEGGKNYGHPLVIGLDDNNYNGLAAAASEHDSLPGPWNTTYPLIVNEKANAAKIGSASYRNPIKTLYPNSNDFLLGILAEIKEGASETPSWPSEAPSSIDVYTSSSIPGWKNSLLIPTLKGGKIMRLKLNEAGDKIVGDTVIYFKSKSRRYRDLAIAPNGLKFYVAVDSSAVTSGPSEEDPQKTSYRGAIIEFSYVGNTSTSGKEKEAQKPVTIERRKKGEKDEG
jgi:PQQ-dependent dehydrogenase (s-GDH family)